MLQAISIHDRTPVVRVPIGDTSTAQRVLDAGAQVLIFPMVNSASEAAMAVAACRYAPLGTRSFGPVRSRMHLGADPERVNAEIACVVMIETPAAVDALEAIVTTPGIDGLYVGPSDFALALGHEVGTDDPELAAMIARIASVARKHGVAAGIHASNGAAGAAYCAQGFAFATICGDAALLSVGAERELTAARDANLEREDLAAPPIR